MKYLLQHSLLYLLGVHLLQAQSSTPQLPDTARHLAFTSGHKVSAVAPDQEDKIIVNRIEYFYRLKALLDRQVWAGFNHRDHELPLVYYTRQHCYVANPPPKFLAIYHPPVIHQTGQISIYKTPLLDSVPFHMETFMNVTDTAAYNYHSLFMACSSYEITMRHPQAEVKDLERWATLVLHEYFHGFQLTHPAFAAYYRDSIMPVSALTLWNMYKDNAWIKQSIDVENDLLLQAIKAPGKKQAVGLIDSFFVMRKTRRELIEEGSGFNIGKYEAFYETMEGTARYIEYRLITIGKKMKPDQRLTSTNTAYHGYAYFRSYQLDQEPSMYLTSKTNYVYAIGFNMARLADRLGLPYKKRLFKERGTTLEALLHSYAENRQ